jgi:two-component system, OmpR family, sensor histidine kinase KdpD
MNLTTEVLVVGAVIAVALLGGLAGRYAGQAAGRPIAEANRMRMMLLAAVSHDLRTPLAAALAAVSCLRSDDVQLTTEDHSELLATADESLNQLTQLLASLLDVSRLQAGVLPVFPRPADLEEIIAHCLGGIGPQARAVTVRLPPGLPRAMVDPPIMERVIVNLTANALRYSPSGSPPLLTASARGGRVVLRVVDYGPGVPEADRDRIFAAFQRLGDVRSTIGVGLGLTVSRGLTEAMGGTLDPEETPGGGLTMAIMVPAASAFFDGERDQQRRSFSAGACHFDRPPERVNAVGEADESGTAAAIGPPAAVVADREHEDSAAGFGQDVHDGGVRVLRGIRERF